MRSGIPATNRNFVLFVNLTAMRDPRHANQFRRVVNNV
jgi:hypothetical protein